MQARNYETAAEALVAAGARLDLKNRAGLTPREGALSDQGGSRRLVLIADANEPQIESQTSLPFPLFQLIARGDPAGGDDVREIPPFAAQRRGPAVRARHRHLPRDSADVVEQVWADVRR